jgi:hypothetical protein
MTIDLEQLRDSVWLDEVGRATRRFQLVDGADFDGPAGRCRLVLVAPEEDPARWYAVVADATGNPREGWSVFDELVIDGLRHQRSVPTERGGVVAFHGDAPPYDETLPFDGGWSSNALSLVRLGGTPHIHKRYRLVHTASHEPAALRLSRGGECLPEYRGEYSYVSSRGGRYPLGVIYQYVDGQPLERLLRDNLRALWTVPAGGAAQHTERLAPVLRAAGELIRRLHDTLASAVTPQAPGTDLDVAACLARTEEALRAVLAWLRADAGHPPAVRQRIAAALRAAAGSAAEPLYAPGAPRLRAGVCHGDLHLSHLLCQQAADGSWRVRAIDVSPPAIDPGDPAFTQQSPWQDLVAVRRGLEAFAAHEAMVQAAAVLDADRRQTCRAAVHDACAQLSDRAARVRAGLSDAADAWVTAVFGLIVAGYGAGEHAPVREDPWWRLLWLHRLLHELDYNYAHGRTYQVNIDLRHAAGLGW